MKNRLWLALAAGAVFVLLSSMSTTGAHWHEQATVDAGTLNTGNLVLLVGGQPEAYNFVALNAVEGNNLTPGKAVRAPLTITNGGSTDMRYSLSSVAATRVYPADQELVSALRLTVTADAACKEVPTGTLLLDHAHLDASTTFVGRPLAPSSSEALCLEIELDEDAPMDAATGTTSVTFTFRGEQAL